MWASAEATYTFDDVTNSAGAVTFCVDHTNDPQNVGTHKWTDSELYTHNDNMVLTWGAKTIPTATFNANDLKIGIKELSTGRILIQDELKPAGAEANASTSYGNKVYSRSGLFGENYSIYQAYLTSGGTILDTDFIVWTYDGLSVAYIDVEQQQYVYGQTVRANYNITDMDTSKYTYKIVTVNLYGEQLDSKTVTSAEGTYTVVPDEDTWDSGFYFVIVQSVTKSNGLISEIGYDTFTLSDTVVLDGSVYDATTGNTLGNGSVNVAQNYLWYNTTVAEDGTYELQDLSVDQAITMNAQKAGYTHAPWSFTPLSSRIYALDLYMFPEDYSLEGHGLYGLVLTDNYYQAIPGATVTIISGSTSYTTTSTSTGYYYFEDIPEGNYTLSASKTGYETVSESLEVTGDVRHDILMTQRYVLTIYARDASTTQYISSFSAYINGVEYSSVNGTVIRPSMAYGQYTITVAASGYHSTSRDYLIDGDKTLTISLTKSPPTYYESHTAEIIYMAYWGTRYPGVNVSVYTGSKEEVIVNGAPSESATLVASGLTGDTGAVTFQLDKATMYTFYAVGTDPAFTKISSFYPKDGRYYIFLFYNPFVDDNTPADNLFYGAVGGKLNLTTAQISAAFNDTSASTTIAEWWVNDSNGNMLYYSSTAENTGSWSAQVPISDNVTYYAYFKIDSGALSEPKLITRIFNFRPTVHPAFDLGFKEQWQYHVVTAFIVMLVAGLFSVRDGHLGAIVVVVLGWLAVYIGYIEPTVTSGLSMTLATMLAGMMYLRKQEML